MTDRENLTNDLYDILIAQNALTDEIQQRIVIALDQYEIQKRVTDVVVADPNDNENVIKRFMVAKAVAGRSKKTIEQYARAVRKFIGFVNKQLLDVVPDDFRAYLAHRMIDDGIRGITLVNERSFISTFYDWAVSAELVMRNPIRMTDPIKVPREPKKSFTEIGVEKIRSACKTLKEKAIVETLFSTACRVSELTSIKTADIDENRVMICGKGHKYGQVYLTSKAMYAIDQYVGSRKDDNPYLIPGTKKRGMSNMGVEKILKQIGERAGVDDVHPHRFRRTAATMAFRRGMSIEMVSKMLRHNRLQTTMIYLDISDEELMYQHKKYAG